MRFNTILSLILIGLSFIACNREADSEISEKTGIIFSPSTLEVTYEGGHYKVLYTLDNPIDGIQPVASCENTSWIKDLSLEENGILSLSILTNEEEIYREASIQIHYGESQIIGSLSVKQEAAPTPFEVSISGISETSFFTSVKPFLKEIPYMITFCTKSEYEKMSNKDEEIFTKDINHYESLAKAFGININDLLDAYSVKGDTTGFEVTPLLPGTDYKLCIYGINIDSKAKLATRVMTFDVTTKSIEMVEGSFDIKVDVDGVVASIDAQAVGYDGYFYADIFSDLSDYESEEAILNSITDVWMSTRNTLIILGKDPHELIDRLGSKGSKHIDRDLEPNKQYVMAAFGLDDKAFICTEISYKVFETSEVKKSDNTFTIEISDLKARSAHLKVTPSNEDSYACFMLSEAEIVSCHSDAEIIDYIVNNYPMGDLTHSVIETTLPSLLPSTGYRICAFGYVAGQATTKLFSKQFITANETISHDYVINGSYTDYYDAMEVAKLNPEYESMAQAGQVFVPIIISVQPQAKLYWNIYKASDVDKPSITEDMIVDILLREGTEGGNNVFILPYGAEFKVCAVAFADDGITRSELWISDKVTITKEGIGEARDFVNSNPLSLVLPETSFSIP